VTSSDQLYGPLEIRGFTFERILGSGGFADVFLYGQHMPKRRVAVKIMRAVVTAETARVQFESEANLMAQLSSHPSIVTIHFAAVAENGRPFLVMEYCSGPNLADRSRQKPLSVPEMLQIMIRLCGAVETAHREGILHRDIKPANVLTTDYGWPALTDFGISVIAGEATIGDGGISIPWSPPEAIGGAGKLDVRSDIYSLAATAYTLLVGRSPFDQVSGSPNLSALMQRIHSDPVPPINRSDVPYELDHLLALAMSKDPDDRPQSASELARGFQRIEQDMSLPVTHMDVPGGLLNEVEGLESLSEEAEKTRMRGARDDEDEVDEEEPTRLSSRTIGRAAARAQVGGDAAAGDGPDEATRVRQPPRMDATDPEGTAAPDDDEEADGKTRVVRRAELDEKTRARTPAPATPEERTQVRPRTRGVAVQTTAADLPRRAERVAYDPGLDPAAVNQTYAIRAPEASQIQRRVAVPPPPTVRSQPGDAGAPRVHLDVVAAANRRAAARRRKGIAVIIAIVVVVVVLVVLAAVFIPSLLAGS
jgi:eukaryotic-like serine/threonine-protein kinase